MSSNIQRSFRFTLTGQLFSRTKPHTNNITRRLTPPILANPSSRKSTTTSYPTTTTTTTTTSSRTLHTTPTPAMSSDADYASFLDKANQSTNDGSASASSKKDVGTKSVNTAVPQPLQEVEEYFVSDADEPFEPVALKFDGKGSVSADDLKSLLSHASAVTPADEKQLSGYKKVIEAVKKAGNGKVAYFRVELGGTRTEYYVVSVDEGEGRLVGLKALAVES
ncbi:hypothetical protein BU24DRAFT_420108 [Aaosphaeria arxii CBS 175.79]|uniref:Uncharacterized protein n=1 Tax=Aaosphaeria arxii CBS 175.79 TaxID=1450172 RepID=A0A6A5XWL4_9PLEO|nr:uncharacterized protein BU24DRAFT_420108 [Aaosphaeria arxii CBS 175.79]KAF2017081.1 hypothetical protein BU24DRAFT_420108 [Aaosphaeria arxii CBS 175.79]